MKTLLRRFLFSLSFLLFPLALLAAGNNPATSGVYAELLVGVDPQTQTVTGYYQNGTGSNADHSGPQFSCVFYLVGKKTGESYAVQTWFPGDPKLKKLIGGELRWTAGEGKNPALLLKLKELPGGCGMVDPDLASPQGEQMLLDTPGQWREVRVVAAKRAHFFENPEAIAPRKSYVVQGDGLRVWEQRPGWVQADFEGKNKGWVKEEDLYPNQP